LDLQDLRALLDLFITTPVRDIWGAFIRRSQDRFLRPKIERYVLESLKKRSKSGGKKPHSSLPTFPSHTHTYTNFIPLDSWSISRDSTTPLSSLCVHRPCQGYTLNPSGLPVRSQGCTYNPTGLPVRSQGCTRRQTPSQDAPRNLSPDPEFYVSYYISSSPIFHRFSS